MKQANPNKIDSMENWRNEHGTPDFDYLRSLVQSEEPRELEKLYSIANDLNVTYHKNTTPNDLLEKIRLVTQTGSYKTT
jgi:hypothetical protein